MPRFRVDSVSSTIEIDLKVNLHPSHLVADPVSGWIECSLDRRGKPRPDVPHGAELSVPVEGIRSGNSLQDREMRRRFAVGRYPKVTVKVTEVEPLDGDTRYRAAARLRMRGTTRAITGEVTITVDGTTMTVQGEQTINMKDFGVDPPRLLILRVEPQVNVRARIVAVRQ